MVLNDALLAQTPDDLHTILDYRPHAKAHSIYNTPPVFAIYALMLVTRWLLNDIGGVANMAALNTQKRIYFTNCLMLAMDFIYRAPTRPIAHS